MLKNLIVFLIAAGGCSAQTNGSAMPFVKPQFFDNGGRPAASYKACFYSSGTTTPRLTYTTSALNVANANPVVLDASGRAAIFFSANSYKVTLLLPTSSTTDCVTGTMSAVWTQDNIANNADLLKAALAGIGGAALVGFRSTSGTSAVTVASVLNSAHPLPEWWGAKGDGSTDDCTAVQNAVNASPSLRFTSAAGYLINCTVTFNARVSIIVDSGVTLMGGSSIAATHGMLECASGGNGSSLTGDGHGSLLTRTTGAVDNTYIVNVQCSNFSALNFRLSGNGVNAAAGEHAHNLNFGTAASHLSIAGIWSDGAQGDGISGESAALGCVDVSVTGSHFINMGRSFLVVAGFGCDRLKFIGNDFQNGTLVATSTSHGAQIDLEPDDVTGSSANSEVSYNTFSNAIIFLSDSYLSGGFRDIGNTGTYQHSASADKACHVLVNTTSALVMGNYCGATGGSGSLERGMLIGNTVAGNTMDVLVTGNTIENPSASCYLGRITSGAQAGTSIKFADNLCRGAGGGGIQAGGSGYGSPAVLSVTNNQVLSVTGNAYSFEGVGAFDVKNNRAQDYTGNGLILTCNGNPQFTANGPGEIVGNILGNNTTVSAQAGINLTAGCGSQPIWLKGNNLSGNFVSTAGAGVSDARYVWDNQNVFSGATPTASAISVGWGAGATATPSGNENYGSIDLHVGAALGSPPYVFTVNYPVDFPYSPQPIVAFSGGSALGSGIPTCYLLGGSGGVSGFQVTCTTPTGATSSTHILISWSNLGSGLN